MAATEYEVVLTFIFPFPSDIYVWKFFTKISTRYKATNDRRNYEEDFSFFLIRVHSNNTWHSEESVTHIFFLFETLLLMLIKLKLFVTKQDKASMEKVSRIIWIPLGFGIGNHWFYFLFSVWDQNKLPRATKIIISKSWSIAFLYHQW